MCDRNLLLAACKTHSSKHTTPYICTHTHTPIQMKPHGECPHVLHLLSHAATCVNEHTHTLTGHTSLTPSSRDRSNCSHKMATAMQSSRQTKHISLLLLTKCRQSLYSFGGAQHVCDLATPPRHTHQKTSGSGRPGGPGEGNIRFCFKWD